MTTKAQQFDELLKEYATIKDQLLEFTEEYHDQMLFDIEGYNEVVFDDEDKEDYIEDIKPQVEAFRAILNASKNLKYMFA